MHQIWRPRERVFSSRCSDGAWIQPNLLVQGRGRRLGLGVELGVQNRLYGLIVPQGLRPLAVADVAAHHQPMRILAARVKCQQMQRVAPTRLEIPALEGIVGQAHQQRQTRRAQVAAFEDRLRLEAAAQRAGRRGTD